MLEDGGGYVLDEKESLEEEDLLSRQIDKGVRVFPQSEKVPFGSGGF